jgi:hypothetical protein
VSEAVEYRVKRNRQHLLYGFALVFMALGASVAVLSLPHASIATPGVMLGIGLVLSGHWLALRGAAMGTEGFARGFMDAVYSSPSPDPPLDEWEAELEERGAFEGGEGA